MFFGGLNGDGFGEEYEWGAQGRYEVGEDRASYTEHPKTRCKYCGQNNLYWHKVNGQYRLYTSNSHHTSDFIHTCENYKPKENLKSVARVDVKLLGSKYIRHPDNKCGTGTNEFYETEYKLWGLPREKYWKVYRDNAPKCPACGTPKGFSFGTGDCGCDVGYQSSNPYQG